MCKRNVSIFGNKVDAVSPQAPAPSAPQALGAGAGCGAMRVNVRRVVPIIPLCTASAGCGYLPAFSPAGSGR
jgi:hypothetical protein